MRRAGKRNQGIDQVGRPPDVFILKIDRAALGHESRHNGPSSLTFFTMRQKVRTPLRIFPLLLTLFLRAVPGNPFYNKMIMTALVRDCAVVSRY